MRGVSCVSHSGAAVIRWLLAVAGIESG